MSEARFLKDLRSVGPATIEDLALLSITTVKQLAKCDPEKLYKDLCSKTGKKHDPCCLDVFRAAVEQAKNPNLSEEKSNWWYWSKIRKQN